MTPREFVQKYFDHAMKAQEKTSVPALVIMAQAALETGWGSTVVGNMMFGVKDTDGINGNEQLLTTTEYFNNPDKKFPVVLKVVQVSKNLWKYTVKDYFRKYATPEESFTDHAQLLSRSGRYRKAMSVTRDPYLFASAIAAGGYATDPDYAKKLHKIIRLIEDILIQKV